MRYLLSLLLFVACRQLSKGKIIDKHFEPGHYQTSTHFYNHLPVVEQYWVPPSYRLTVKGYTKEGKLISEYWYVSSGIYERNSIDGWINSTDTTTDF